MRLYIGALPITGNKQLDKAVDLCYRPQHFANKTKRIEYFFELSDKYTSGMFVGGKKERRNKKIYNTMATFIYGTIINLAL